MMVKRLFAILRGKRGETLMEGIASLFVFAILIATVTMTILVSLRITGAATAAAEADQVAANEALRGKIGEDESGVEEPYPYGPSPPAEIVLTGDAKVTIEIEVTWNGQFIAFAPTN